MSFALIALIVPAFVVGLTYRTRFHWLTGALMIAGAFYLFSQVGPVDHDESNPWGGFENFVYSAGGVLAALYGLGALIVSSRLHAKFCAERAKATALPAATVVAGVTPR